MYHQYIFLCSIQVVHGVPDEKCQRSNPYFRNIHAYAKPVIQVLLYCRKPQCNLANTMNIFAQVSLTIVFHTFSGLLRLFYQCQTHNKLNFHILVTSNQKTCKCCKVWETITTRKSFSPNKHCCDDVTSRPHEVFPGIYILFRGNGDCMNWLRTSVWKFCLFQCRCTVCHAWVLYLQVQSNL